MRPFVRRSPHHGPAGETGLIPAVRIAAENDDPGERQDASRTTAEYKVVQSSDHAPEAEPRSEPLILIVEDNIELAKLIQITLTRGNLHSIIETSGHRALERYHETQPDIVLLDLGLPDMTGWKVLEGIRESARDNGQMPVVIVITAYADAANRLVGKLQNVEGYLIKPFTSDDIITSVRQALNGKVG